MMSKGSLMIDAMLSLLIVACCVSLTSVFVQTYWKETKTIPLFIPWQDQEVPCEIWCEGIYSD